MARRLSDGLRRLSGGASQEPEILGLSVARGNGTLGLALILDTSRVTNVTAGSAAEHAGVCVFDRVIAVNGMPLSGPLGGAVAAVQAAPYLSNCACNSALPHQPTSPPPLSGGGDRTDRREASTF